MFAFIKAAYFPERKVAFYIPFLNMWKFLLVPESPTFGMVSSFNCNHFGYCAVVFHCGFNLFFPGNTAHYAICYWPFAYLLLWSIECFTHFLIRLSFHYWATYRILLKFWIQSSCPKLILQILFTLWFAYSFLNIFDVMLLILVNSNFQLPLMSFYTFLKKK